MADTEDFEALLRQYDREHPAPAKATPQAGDHVRGTIISIDAERAFVDLGGKVEGSIDIAELTDPDGTLKVAEGDSVEAVVISNDERTGTLLLGTGAQRHVHDTGELEEAFRSGLPVEGLVSAVTKGGLEVQVAGLRAFCPASQADIRFVEDLEPFVGQHLSFRVTRIEGGRHPNVVLSRRAVLEEERAAQAEAVRAQLEPGAVLPGVVTSLKDFGAFVDLGGVEGMIHVSELAYGRVKHPQDLLSVGQAVEVAVLRIEKSDNPRHPQRIALSLRALAANPWQQAGERYAAGARVRGTVTRLQPFGAFVELEPGLEGLVHISELGAGRRITHPREVLNEGDTVEVTVLGVDTEKQRISLSLEADAADAAEMPAAPAAPREEPRAEPGVGTFGELLRREMEKRGKK